MLRPSTLADPTFDAGPPGKRYIQWAIAQGKPAERCRLPCPARCGEESDSRWGMQSTSGRPG